jgi:hypothetical protein
MDYLFFSFSPWSMPMSFLGFFIHSQSGNHPQEDLAKSGYKPEIKYKYVIILLFFDHKMKTKSISLAIFPFSFSLKTSKITSL